MGLHYGEVHRLHLWKSSELPRDPFGFTAPSCRTDGSYGQEGLCRSLSCSPIAPIPELGESSDNHSFLGHVNWFPIKCSAWHCPWVPYYFLSCADWLPDTILGAGLSWQKT